MSFIVAPSRKPGFWAIVEGKEAPKKKPAPAPSKNAKGARAKAAKREKRK